MMSMNGLDTNCRVDGLKITYSTYVNIVRVNTVVMNRERKDITAESFF